MAFTGNAVFAKVSDNIVRITGLSLGAGATGTISLAGGTGGVKLPHAFKPDQYKGDGQQITLVDSLDVTVAPADVVAHAALLHVAKAGVDPATWVASVVNDDGSNATPALEIYVKFHE